MVHFTKSSTGHDRKPEVLYTMFMRTHSYDEYLKRQIKINNPLSQPVPRLRRLFAEPSSLRSFFNTRAPQVGTFGG
jgi:hypothetical protein